MQAPAVTIADFGVGNAGLFEQQFNLKLRIQNPNPEEFRVDGMAFDLEINEQPFARGVGNQAVTVPRYGSAFMPVEAVSTLGGLIRQFGRFDAGRQAGVQIPHQGQPEHRGRHARAVRRTRRIRFQRVRAQQALTRFDARFASSQTAGRGGCSREISVGAVLDYMRYTSSRRRAMPSDHIVEISNLQFAYGDRPLLKGVSLTIPRGKVVGIMGASGCGKSTLMRLIGGQLVPAGGYVKVDGQVVHELGRDALYQLRRKMGMQFQAGGLFTDLSVYENIAFQMREHTDLPESMIRDLVLLKLAAVGLRGAAHLMPAELSGGMARRVGLARAIALDPMLIMYDEPFAGLDPISCSVVGNLIRRLNDALGATSIVVSYDAAESMRVIDYLYLISDGVVAAAGPAARDERFAGSVRAPVSRRRARRTGAVSLPARRLQGPTSALRPQCKS